MYILLKRHPLEDDDKIIGVFDDKNIALSYMNNLYEKDFYCYTVMYYPLNNIDTGKIVSYITSDS
jgi:hypothetical protein